MGGTRSKVEGGDRHDLEPEGTHEDLFGVVYRALRLVLFPGGIVYVLLGTRFSFI
jgi:hypothetical protein